jgi:glycosyltransferase involved in cell wall biosynthesis
MTDALLSIAVPTRNRPQLLERAMRSVLAAADGVEDRVEVAISDGSSDLESAAVVHTLLAGWPGGLRYVRNDPPLPQVTNINNAIAMTSAPWVLQLHDDDHLLPGSARVMIETTSRAAFDERLFLFGVYVVDENGVGLKHQSFRRDHYLAPPQALRTLLSRSSFVRQPAIVIHRGCYDEAGLYDDSLGGPTDIEMYVRLFSRHGLRCIARTTCAYTVHSSAATTEMWNAKTIFSLDGIFDGAAALGVVPERSIRRWQANFFHQFILAGTYRRLRAKQHVQARQTLDLFDLSAVKRLGPSLKWTPVRIAFELACLALTRRSPTHDPV